MLRGGGCFGRPLAAMTAGRWVLNSRTVRHPNILVHAALNTTLKGADVRVACRRIRESASCESVNARHAVSSCMWSKCELTRGACFVHVREHRACLLSCMRSKCELTRNACFVHVHERRACLLCVSGWLVLIVVKEGVTSLVSLLAKPPLFCQNRRGGGRTSS